MPRVPQPPTGGQGSPPSILDTPRAAFVWREEALETLAALDAIADDATRRPSRRKLPRREARRAFQKARAGLTWLRRMMGEVAPC